MVTLDGVYWNRLGQSLQGLKKLLLPLRVNTSICYEVAANYHKIDLLLNYLLNYLTMPVRVSATITVDSESYLVSVGCGCTKCVGSTLGVRAGNAVIIDLSGPQIFKPGLIDKNDLNKVKVLLRDFLNL